MDRQMEEEVNRVLKVKEEHDELRKHRENLHKLFSAGPLGISRQRWQTLLLIHRGPWGSPPIVVDMEDFREDELMVMFPPSPSETRFIPQGAVPDFATSPWRVSLNDEWVLPSHHPKARAIIWSLALRAESKAKNNLMVTMSENSMMLAGRTKPYRDAAHHLSPFSTDGFLFGEIDAKPWDCWALHLRHVPSYADGEWSHNNGLLIVRKPEVIDVEKCERDYAMAMLAGLRPTDLQRRLNNE